MIHVMCGIQGSGKTTLSEQLASEYDAVLYCYDKLPNAYKMRSTHLLMFHRIARDLRCHKTVVCDDLHTTKEMRMTILKAISGIDCKKVLHVMRTPLETCLERVKIRERHNMFEHVVIRCFEQYEEPTFDEGWDEIIYHEYIEEVMPHDN